MPEEQEQIDWEKFAIGGDLHYFKAQKDIEYAISFVPPIEQIEIPFDETDDDGRPLKKIIPALRLHVDILDGKPVELTVDVTSKRWIASIKQFYDKGLLYSHMFSLTRKGEGTQTVYQFYPVSPKKNIKV